MQGKKVLYKCGSETRSGIFLQIMEGNWYVAVVDSVKNNIVFANADEVRFIQEDIEYAGR